MKLRIYGTVEDPPELYTELHVREAASFSVSETIRHLLLETDVRKITVERDKSDVKNFGSWDKEQNEKRKEKKQKEK